MCEYNLSCTKEHSAEHKQGDLKSQCSQDDLLSQHGGGVALSQHSQGDLSSVSHSVMMSCSHVATGKCSLLVDTALSVIKALYCLTAFSALRL